MKLKAKAALQILQPLAVVFEGIVDPDKMTQYFISESNGRLESGKVLLWKFPEFKERFPITKIKIEPHHSISFVWDPDTVVTMELEELTADSTLVRVTEGEKERNEENLNWLVENSGGWANFLACLKAYLEYGISLRKGAFDFMKNNEV